MRLRPAGLLALLVAALPLRGHAAEKAFTVTSFGHGRPFFMIAGLAAGKDLWDDAARRYGVQFRVYRFTLAGFDGLKPVSGPFIDTEVAALEAYARQNDIRNAIVMGNSVAGIIALKLAARVPDRFTTAIVVDILPFLGGPSFGAKDADQAATITDRYKAQMTAMPPADFLAQQTSQISLLTETPDKKAVIARWIKSSDATTIIEATCELYAGDFRPVLPHVRARTLVIYPWDPKSNLAAQTLDAFYVTQYNGLPHKTLRRIDNSRHYVMFDQPGAFFRAVDDFLSTPARVDAKR